MEAVLVRQAPAVSQATKVSGLALVLLWKGGKILVVKDRWTNLWSPPRINLAGDIVFQDVPEHIAQNLLPQYKGLRVAQGGRIRHFNKYEVPDSSRPFSIYVFEAPLAAKKIKTHPDHVDQRAFKSLQELAEMRGRGLLSQLVIRLLAILEEQASRTTL